MADEELVALGDVLDRLGVSAPINPEDLVSSAVVVMSLLVPDERSPRLLIASSDGMSWIEQAGLLRLAERICSDPAPEDEDD